MDAVAQLFSQQRPQTGLSQGKGAENHTDLLLPVLYRSAHMVMDMDMVDKKTLSLFIPHDKTAENKREKVDTGYVC